MRRPFVPLCLATALAFATGPAFAEGQASCPLTYETFEYSVPHTDLEACPASMERDGTFCRVAVVAEIATIFAFSEDSGCIVASRAFDGDHFEIEFK